MVKTPNPTAGLGDWQAMSRQYWDAWADATRKAFGADAGVAGANMPWHEGLEQWSRMFDAGKTRGTQSEVVERLLAGARSYFSLLESMAAKDVGSGAGSSSAAWTDAIREAFNFPGADAALFDNPLARALRELPGQGAAGFEQMMQGLEPAMKEARALLELPAFGYTREHQEHYQRMAKAWLDYQHETNRYNMLVARASRRAFEVFEDKLAEHGEPGRQIDSVRGLYDLWVDAAEDAYAEVALSDEFREVYGALVDAQMRVRRDLQSEVERVATNLGMPTRTEIDSIGRRLHEVRREARDHGDALPALMAEVAALREEVSRLHRAPSDGVSTRKEVPRKTTPKVARKTPAKKTAKTGKAGGGSRKSISKEKA